MRNIQLFKFHKISKFIVWANFLYFFTYKSISSFSFETLDYYASNNINILGSKYWGSAAREGFIYI